MRRAVMRAVMRAGTEAGPYSRRGAGGRAARDGAARDGAARDQRWVTIATTARSERTRARAISRRARASGASAAQGSNSTTGHGAGSSRATRSAIRASPAAARSSLPARAAATSYGQPPASPGISIATLRGSNGPGGVIPIAVAIRSAHASVPVPGASCASISRRRVSAWSIRAVSPQGSSTPRRAAAPCARRSTSS